MTRPEMVVLFDGVCNLCNTSVLFVIRRDPGALFRFAALQSHTGRSLLARHGLQSDDLTSMVVIQGERAWTHSSAALQVARRLTGGWPLFYYLLIWIPAPLRNAVYKVVAARRYRWFGKREACMVPDDALRSRFLE